MNSKVIALMQGQPCSPPGTSNPVSPITATTECYAPSGSGLYYTCSGVTIIEMEKADQLDSSQAPKASSNHQSGSPKVKTSLKTEMKQIGIESSSKTSILHQKELNGSGKVNIQKPATSGETSPKLVQFQRSNMQGESRARSLESYSEQKTVYKNATSKPGALRIDGIPCINETKNTKGSASVTLQNHRAQPGQIKMKTFLESEMEQGQVAIESSSKASTFDQQECNGSVKVKIQKPVISGEANPKLVQFQRTNMQGESQARSLESYSEQKTVYKNATSKPGALRIDGIPCINETKSTKGRASVTLQNYAAQPGQDQYSALSQETVYETVPFSNSEKRVNYHLSLVPETASPTKDMFGDELNMDHVQQTMDVNFQKPNILNQQTKRVSSPTKNLEPMQGGDDERQDHPNSAVPQQKPPSGLLASKSLSPSAMSHLSRMDAVDYLPPIPTLERSKSTPTHKTSLPNPKLPIRTHKTSLPNHKISRPVPGISRSEHTPHNVITASSKLSSNRGQNLSTRMPKPKHSMSVPKMSPNRRSGTSVELISPVSLSEPPSSSSFQQSTFRIDDIPKPLNTQSVHKEISDRNTRAKPLHCCPSAPCTCVKQPGSDQNILLYDDITMYGLEQEAAHSERLLPQNVAHPYDPAAACVYNAGLNQPTSEFEIHSPTHSPPKPGSQHHASGSISRADIQLNSSKPSPSGLAKPAEQQKPLGENMHSVNADKVDQVSNVMPSKYASNDVSAESSTHRHTPMKIAGGIKNDLKDSKIAPQSKQDTVDEVNEWENLGQIDEDDPNKIIQGYTREIERPMGKSSQPNHLTNSLGLQDQLETLNTHRSNVQIQRLKEDIYELQLQAQEKDGVISHLKMKIKDLTAQLHDVDERYQHIVRDKETEVDTLTTQIDDLKGVLESAGGVTDNELMKTQSKLNELTRKHSDVKEQSATVIRLKEEEMKRLYSEIGELTTSLHNTSKDKNSEVSRLKAELGRNKTERETLVESYQTTLSEKQQELRLLRQDIEMLKVDMARLNANKENQISELKQEYEKKIELMEQGRAHTIAMKDSEIDNLKEKIKIYSDSTLQDERSIPSLKESIFRLEQDKQELILLKEQWQSDMDKLFKQKELFKRENIEIKETLRDMSQQMEDQTREYQNSYSHIKSLKDREGTKLNCRMERMIKEKCDLMKSFVVMKKECELKEKCLRNKLIESAERNKNIKKLYKTKLQNKTKEIEKLRREIRTMGSEGVRLLDMREREINELKTHLKNILKIMRQKAARVKRTASDGSATISLCIPRPRLDDLTLDPPIFQQISPSKAKSSGTGPCAQRDAKREAQREAQREAEIK